MALNPIQEEILAIFKEVKKICDNNNIRYFAIGGTCIGAVRHGGFIPWDDDLDIAMPNKDYFRFQEIAKRELPNKYRLHDLITVDHTESPFMKVDNINTAFIETTEKDFPETYKGVYIDIMPMFGAPAPGIKRAFFCAKIAIYLEFNEARNKKYKYVKGIRDKITWVIEKLTPCRKDNRFWAKKWLKEVSKYDFDESDYTGYVWWPKSFKLLFEKKLVENTKEHVFEDTTIQIPLGWDSYLKQQFGNYMELPPENKRVAKHQGIIDLKNSYKLYQEKYKKFGKI